MRKNVLNLIQTNEIVLFVCKNYKYIIHIIIWVVLVQFKQIKSSLN